jgi:predicted dehydrogenase
MTDLRQSWPLPSRPRPIVIVGAGAIVRTAHLPAYQRVGFPVAGLFDTNIAAARETSAQFNGPAVFSTLAEAAASKDAVFDVAVPGDRILGVLQCLPSGAAVLIQKPMGEDLSAARRILEVCRERRLVAAMNFQLRFSPNVLALRDLIDRQTLGDLRDIEVRVVDRQPWEQWSFLKGAPRLEVLYHSIHYLDTIRAIAGEPRSVYCYAVAHPELEDFNDTRSTIILDYDRRIRCSLTMNHVHRHDPTHRASMLKVEGVRGAAVLTMGVNLAYPVGSPDHLVVSSNAHSAGPASAFAPMGLRRDEEAGPHNVWTQIPLRGSWFTEAFEGPMSNLQRFAAGEDPVLVSPVDDAIKTMALVEACYQSSERGGTPIPAAG